jgi:Pectate lyase superfamily protein
MTKPGKALLIATSLLLVHAGPGAVSNSNRAASTHVSIPQESDEFVGPFPSWSNVKTKYGAIGDGKVDDTAMIQRGLDELGKAGHAPVLWLPRGTYRITKTLVLTSNINISVIGEDPATTAIVWDGAGEGTMIWINGVAYSRFTRLTLNGNRRASVAVEQSWDRTERHFDTGNEYSDMYFVDVDYGLYGGFKGHGFAETSIRRAHFVRNVKAGVSLGNFNALDIWVWYSTFDQCGVGVGNGEGAGNFHVYNSVFRGSTVSDLFMVNTGGFSARGNYSARSKAFFVSNSATNNPAIINIQQNVVVDPTDSMAIRLGNQGPGLIVDNVIRSAPEATSPVVNWTSFIDADVASIGNTFTVSRPVVNNGRLMSMGDRIIARNAINAVEPALPGTLPNTKRSVFEVPPGADAARIQQTIDAAAAQNGSRPVVHIPDGKYSISQTLTLPASDIQLVGDGYGTILSWTGAGSGPVIRLRGPSKVALREIQIHGAGRADGLIVENADQMGSRVYMDQAQLRAGKQTNVFVNGLDNTYVQLEDVGYAYSPEAVSVKVIGGPRSSAGHSTAGRTNIYSGASAGNRISYDVSGGAKVLVRDLWYEGGAGPGFAKIHDRAIFTVDGARISSPVNGVPAALDITNLHGRTAILSTHLDDRITIQGNGSRASVLVMGVFAEQKTSDYFLNASSPAARAMLVNSRHVATTLANNRSVPTKDEGGSDPAFVESMLSHTRRERAEPLRALPAGVTDVRMFRVWVSNGLNNVTLE